MFDIAFSELLIIALVALIIIGPERLPRVARVVGSVIGRVRRYAQDVKHEINREIELDELKRLREEVTRSARDLEASVRAEMESAQSAINETVEEIRALPSEDETAPTAKTVSSLPNPQSQVPTL